MNYAHLFVAALPRGIRSDYPAAGVLEWSVTQRKLDIQLTNEMFALTRHERD